MVSGAYDVKKSYRNKKQQNQQSTAYSVRDSYRSKRAGEVGQQILDRVNTWLVGNQKLVSDYESRYSGGNTTYRADSSDYLSKVTKQKSEFDKEADSLRALLGNYEKYLNQDFVSEVKGALDAGTKASGDILSIATQDDKYWTQWDSEEAYNRYYQWVSPSIPNSEKYDKDFDEKSKYQAGKDDELYEYINSDDETRAKMIDKQRHTQKYMGYYSKAIVDTPYRNYYFVSDDEKSLYNYYYNTEGKEKAKEYLDYLEPSLKYQYADSLRKAAQEVPAAEYLFAIGAGLDQYYTGLVNLVNPEYQSTVQMTSGMIREDLADEGAKLPEWMGGASLGQAGYDLINTTSNMLPSILIGFAHPVAGAASMGLSAAGNAYAEMINLGYDEGQARVYSTLVGGSEALLSYFLGGIKNVGGKATSHAVSKLLSRIDNAYARVAIKIGGNILSEGIEESLQSVLEPWFKSIATGETFEAPEWGEVIYSGVLGAVTALVLEGAGDVASGVNTYHLGKTIKQSGAKNVTTLTEFGKSLSDKSVANRLANKINSDTGAYTIGRLYQEIGATVSEQNKTDIIDGLTKRGVRKHHAKKIANTFQSIIDNSLSLSDAQMGVMEQFSPLADVLREDILGIDTELYRRSQGYTNAMSDIRNGENVDNDGNVIENAAQRARSGTVSQMGVQKENAAGGVFEGQAAQSENASGVESDEAIEMRRVVEDTGMPQATADAMVETYRPVEGMTAREYAAAFAEAEMYGRRGVSEAALARNEQIAKLPADVARAAYGLGVKAADNTNAGVQKENATAGAGAGVKYSIDGKASSIVSINGEPVVELDLNSEIQKELSNATPEERGKIVEKHLKQAVAEVGSYTFHDGTVAIMDNSDISKISHTKYEPKNRISVSMEDIVKVARLYATDSEIEHNKFSEFKYYRAGVKIGKDIYAFSVNVGLGKYDGEYHIYDINQFDQKNGSGSPVLANPRKSVDQTVSRATTPNPIVAQTEPGVKKKNTEISRPSLRPGRVLRAEGVNVQKFSDAQYATYKAAEIMARALGTDIVIHESLGKTKDGKVINGYFDPKDGRIHVNINAMRDGSHIGLYVLSHEVTHAIKEWSPRKYAELERFVMERLGADAEVKIEAKLKQMRDAGLISETATEAEAYALAKEEVVADGMEGVLDDGEVLGALARDNRTLFEKIKDVVTAAIGKIKAAYNELNKHSKTAKVLTDTVESLESLEQLFYEGVVDAGENRRGGLPQNGTSFIALYDIVELDNGMQYVEATESQVIKGEDPNKWAQQVASYINRVIRGGTDLTILTTQGDKLTITRDTAYKAGTRNQIRNPDGTYRTMTDAEYRVKLNAEIHINELAEVSKKPNKPKQPDYKNHAFAKDGFTYRTAYFKDFDGKYYKLTISVGENGDVSTVYNVGKIKEDTLPSGKVVSTFSGSKANSASSPHSISQDGEAVKPKLSISDETLIDKYPHLDLNQDVSGMDGVPAIRLEDGSVLSFTEPHVQFIQQSGIDVEDIESGGWISDGVYEASERSDTLRYKERMMAKKRMDAKRASKAKFSIESGDPSVDADVSKDEAGGASPSPTNVEAEVQNEAVARVEKAEAATEKELKAENAKLREDVEHLKELLKLQRTVTDGTTFTKASMSRAASRIMKVIGATKGKTQLLEQISQLYAEIATAEQVDMEDIMSRAEEIAEELIDEQPGTRVPGDPEYAEILDYLRSTSFSLTDVQKQEAAYRYGSYESFRRRMMGKLKIKKNAASLDVIWGELCELYPGIFSTEMNEADMVEAIVQIRHDAVINQTAFAYIDKDAAISDVARTIYDGYWDAVPVHTLADEHRREVSLLKAKHARVTEEIRASADRRVAAMRESLKEQNRRVREQRDEAVRKERERADARIEGWRERRQETKDRHAVRRATSRLYKRLLSPTKERNVPESLRAAVAEALGAMKLDARVMDQIADIEAEIEKLERQDAPDLKKIETLESKLYKLEENAASLKEQSEAILRAYEAAAKEKDSPLADEIVEKLRELQAEIGESPVGIYDMDRKQLRAARDFYEMILHQVTNANKMLAADRQATVDKNGTAAMIEMSESKAPKFLKPRAGEARSMVTLRKYLWQMLKPINAVEMLGSDTLSHAFANLHRGEGVCSVDLAEAQEKFQAEAETYHFWDWDRVSRREFKTANGKTVKLTLGQMMSLYAYSKRENAHQHLREGGFTFAPDATYKGKITERMLQDSERYTLTEAEFGKIASALTEEQRAFADAMQEYLSKDMAAKGNEVSVKLYGIKLFGEANYWPMRSAREYLDSETGKTGDPKIKNKGFTKRVVPDAGNPLVLSDFMETWNGHVGEMALYHGMTLPMEDMNRLLNFKPGGDFDAEGADAGRSTSITKYSSMKELIREKYGYEAVTYIEQLLRDLNGGVRSGVPMDLIDKGISLFKKSAVMASASVVIQQPSSIARAWAMINPKYFANTKGLDFKNSRENYEELKKYAPIAIVKEMGGFDTGVGQATSDYIMEREYKGGEKLGAFFKDKAYRDHVFGYAASKADQMAWLQLWEACKREQAELHPDMAADSDEVMKLAGERFTDIVTRTQVYDSTLSRSAMMRSKDTTWKMATAFMAEPTTVFNMLVMGAVKLQRGDAKAFRGVVGSVIAATFLNAVLASLVYAARDDDEDKSYPEKYVEALVGESIDSFNPLTLLPIVKDIWSLVQGYNVERTDMAVVADMIDAVNKLKIDENTTGEEIAEKWINLAVSFSSVFGLPLRNLQRDARAIGNVISNKNKSTWSGVGYAARESAVKQIPFGKLFGVSVNVSDGQQLYEAAVTGNDKQYARVTARFESETAARTALRTALRDNDPRIEEAARARLDADTATYARLVREIVAEGYFSQTDVVAAVNSEYNAMVRDIESGAEDNADPDAGDEAIASIYKSADLNAELDAGDWKQAKVIIDDMVAAKIASGKSQKQARAAIKSGVTSYWKPLYLEAYASRNSAELRRIRALLARTRLYGTASEVAETVAGWVKDEAKKKAEAKKIARQGG